MGVFRVASYCRRLGLLSQEKKLCIGIQRGFSFRYVRDMLLGLDDAIS